MAKKNTHDRALGIRMDEDIVKALERIATELDLSVSWCIRRACQQFVQRYDASKSSVVALAVEPVIASEDSAQVKFDREFDQANHKPNIESRRDKSNRRK